MVQNTPFYLFLAALTIFRFVYTGFVDLVADEAHFWIWSQNVNVLSPDHFGSYHPPMVAYFIWLSSFLGESERAIRFTAVMGASTITLIVYHLASKIFNSRKAGFVAAVIPNVTPIFALGGLVVTTDTPFILFWTIMLFLGHKIIETKNRAYWYALGITFGLALTSKFTAFLFAASFFLYLVFSSEHRFWLKRKDPYIAFTLGLILFSPVVIWNLTNEGGAFRFHFGRAFNSHQIAPMERFITFWGGQVGLYGGPLILFIIAGAFGVGWMALKEKRNDYMYLFFMSAPLIVFFFFNSFRSNMEGNWSAGAYVAAIIATPGFLAYAIKRVSHKWRTAIKGGFAISIAFSAIAVAYSHAYIVDPSLPMFSNVKIAKRFYGWSELGRVSAHKLEGMSDSAFILTDWYHTASLLNYYIPSRPQSFLIKTSDRFKYFSPGPQIVGRDALYVSEKNRLHVARVAKLFEKVEPAGVYTIKRNNKVIEVFYFFRCYNYRGVKAHS